MFPDSFVPVAGGEGGTVVRTALTPEEAQSSMDFSVSLRMRNFDELEARIQSGEKIAPAEMEAKYLPLQSDYDRTAAWLVSEGFTLTSTDPNHTNLFARGTVAGVARSFGVSFARVATADGEFTSAVTAPSIPAEVAEPVLGIDGLQPHVRKHPPPRVKHGNSVTSVGPGFFTPADISAAYKVPAGLTGAGQTICIIVDSGVTPSDLTTFWTTAGVAQTIQDFTQVNVSGTPGSDVDEASLDAEWAGAIAPGAKIRLYAMPSLSNNSILAACAQIVRDASVDSSLTVVSMSFGGPEAGNGALQQQFAIMMAEFPGMTICAASGDGGSRPNNSTGYYNANQSLSVSYPGSDPNVTGVGGTTVNFDSNYNDLSETVWFQNLSGKNYEGSGGGLSAVFSRPTWQLQSYSGFSTNVPATGVSVRCQPDVAAVSDGAFNGSQFGGFIVVGGQTDPGNEGIAGTSLATQVFAGLVAILNQARSETAQSAKGLLGPLIYPLIGTAAFTDVTSGSNGTDGVYTAGAGYDLCSGIGTPSMSNLIAALAPPMITAQPQSTSTTVGGTFSFSVTATGGGTLGYQWYFNGSAISGQTSPTYLNGNATAGNAGSYTVVVSDAAGSTTSNAATLTVNSPAASSPAPASGGGGGGGAPSLWFYGALALLAAARLAWRQRAALAAR
jgi:kumamolisin